MSALFWTAAPAAGMTRSTGWPAACVLDTNIVLDIWVFEDPHVQPMSRRLGLSGLGLTAVLSGAASLPKAVPDVPCEARPVVRWLATRAMRDELARVLTYPHLVRRQPLGEQAAHALLAAYDAAVTWCEPAPKARFVCTDADDQKFIDLAVAHGAVLVSKDKAVLRLKKRLASLGVEVLRSWPGQPADHTPKLDAQSA
ncbi:MAG TPA: PIN domain-containing protein [Burkholderiaceae bacterium]|nr:PIN domain-containing protein [Burkholderiaceae bacterium]